VQSLPPKETTTPEPIEETTTTTRFVVREINEQSSALTIGVTLALALNAMVIYA